MAYFWDYIFIPALVTLGLHGLLIYLMVSGLQIESYDILPQPEPNFIKATLVELPKAKPKPKPRQPKPIAKPKVENLATPKSIPEVVETQQLSTPDQVSSAEPESLVQDFSRIFDALQEEDMLLQEETDQTTVGKYEAIIRQNIESKWSRPPSARNGMQVKLAIQLVPSGEVVSVNVIESSGDAAFDTAAVQAVQRVSRFSALAELETRLFEAYFRELNLLFKPEDLLL